MAKISIPNVLKVFISSKDLLGDERATIEKAVMDLSMVPIRTESTTWVASRNFDEYLRQTRESDIVILLLEENHTDVTNFEEYYKYVKEEVDIAFSDGKSVLLLVKENLNSDRLNEFLSEVQFKVFARKFRNCVELYDVTQASLMNELFRKYRSKPIFLENRKELYAYCSKFIKRTQYKALICENTPSFLLGPRLRVSHEKEFYDSINEFLLKIAAGNCQATVVLIFNIDRARKELKENLDRYDTSLFRKNCHELRNMVGSQISVIGADQEIITFFVSDHTYIIGQHISRRAVILIDNSPEIVNKLEVLTNYFSADAVDQGIKAFEGLLDEVGL